MALALAKQRVLQACVCNVPAGGLIHSFTVVSGVLWESGAEAVEPPASCLTCLSMIDQSLVIHKWAAL